MKENCLKGCFDSKAGFTLIELLVVVLIIGILAAVALPQYKMAVLKSKYSGMRVITRKIMDSLEVYYLENGKYPDSLADTDIEVEKCFAEVSLDCPTIRYAYYRDFSHDEYMVQAMFKEFVGLGYREVTKHGNSRFNTAGKQQCIADSGNLVTNQVCKSLGEYYGTSDLYAPQSYRFTYNSWNLYDLK